MTSGVAGGLHKPYKGIGQLRLKAHEKVRQSQHYYGLRPPGGGSLFALAYWLTRERVGKFFQADLVRGYVLLQLIPYIFLYHLLPTVST